MSAPTGYNATPITAAGTTQIFTGTGLIAGFFVASGTTVTVAIYDNTTTSGTPLLATFTAPANGYYPFQGSFGTGLRVVVAGTSPNVTVFWVQA